MKKQYIVQKYVLAESVAEALRKSKGAPVHEIFLHSQWFEKNRDNNFFEEKPRASIGLKAKKSK